MKTFVNLKTVINMLLLLIFTGCSPAFNITLKHASPTSTPRPPYVISTNLVAKGELVPERIADLAFSTSGIAKAVNIEIGDEVYAGDALVQLETNVLEADVAHFEGMLQAAQAEFEYQKKLSVNSSELAIIAARLKVAEADLMRARCLLDQATLKAPFDGIVVDLHVETGEMVSPGRIVVTLADPKSFVVETIDLSGEDIPRVYRGQPVVVFVGALNLKLDGKVSTIVPRATLLGGEKVFVTTIKLASQPAGLYWGMSVDVTFEE